MKWISPKKLHRLTAKEGKQAGIGTKVQEALKRAVETRKQTKRIQNKKSAFKDSLFRLRKKKSRQNIAGDKLLSFAKAKIEKKEAA